MGNSPDEKKSFVSPVDPLAVYMSGLGSVSTPEHAQELFRTMESTAEGNETLKAQIEERRADYSNRLNQAKQGLQELIDKSLDYLKTRSILDEDNLADYMESALNRGVLILKDGRYHGNPLVDRSDQLAHKANQRLDSFDYEAQFERVANASNGHVRYFDGVRCAFQIAVKDTEHHRLIKVYNLAPLSESPETIRQLKDKFQRIHIPGLDAPEFIVNTAISHLDEWDEINEQKERCHRKVEEDGAKIRRDTRLNLIFIWSRNHCDASAVSAESIDEKEPKCPSKRLPNGNPHRERHITGLNRHRITRSTRR